jgi:hypothetical protein
MQALRFFFALHLFCARNPHASKINQKDMTGEKKKEHISELSAGSAFLCIALRLCFDTT